MRNKSVFKFSIGIIGATLITISFQGCGHYTSPYAIGYGTPSLIGPGDWSAYLNPSAGVVEFQHLANLSAPVDYIGIANSTSYTTGFDGLLMNSVGPQDNGSGPVGSTSQDVQISGFAYFWAPFVGAGPVQAMVPPTCPAADIVGNFIALQPQTGWAVGTGGSNAFGTMTFSAVSGGSTINNNYNLDTSGVTADAGSSVVSSGSGGCISGRYSDGLSETSAGPNNFLVAASNGAYYFATQSGTAPAVSTLAGSYAGMLYQAGAGTNSPVKITLDSSGSGTLTVVSDVSTGSSTATTFAVSLGSALTGGAAGFLNGTIAGHTLVCLGQAAVASSSHNLLACVGEDGSHAFMSLVLVSH